MNPTGTTERTPPSELVVGGRLYQRLTIAKLPNWQQRAALRLARLPRRLRERDTLLRRDPGPERTQSTFKCTGLILHVLRTYSRDV